MGSEKLIIIIWYNRTIIRLHWRGHKIGAKNLDIFEYSSC